MSEGANDLKAGYMQRRYEIPVCPKCREQLRLSGSMLDLPVCPAHGALTIDPIWITVAEVAPARSVSDPHEAHLADQLAATIGDQIAEAKDATGSDDIRSTWYGYVSLQDVEALVEATKRTGGGVR